MSSILFFGPVERKMPVDSWKNIQADSAPPGTYTPNMTPKFLGMWKGEVIGVNTGNFKVEIRRVIRGVCVCINVLGEKYVPQEKVYSDRWKRADPALSGGCVAVSMNGTVYMAPSDLAEMNQAIEEAIGIIRLLEAAPDKPAQQAIIDALKNSKVS